MVDQTRQTSNAAGKSEFRKEGRRSKTSHFERARARERERGGWGF